MQKESENPRFLSVIGVAKILSVSRSSIDRMIRAGELPAVSIGDARRIEVSDLEAWIAAQKAASLIQSGAQPKNPVIEQAEIPPSRRRGRPQKAGFRKTAESAQ